MSADEKRKVRNLMRCIKRAQASDDRCPSDFPKWTPGMPTLAYVRQWEKNRRLVKTC